MVQIHYSVLFVASLAVLGFAAPSSKRTVPQVEADIKNINANVVALNNALNAFPNSGGSLSQALAIHTSATTVESSLNKGTTDVAATPNVGESDAKTIIDAVQAFEPTILTALNTIIGKRAAFQALPVGGIVAIVRKDINDLNVATVAFGTNLISGAPPDLKARAQAIKASIDVAFAKAVAAYK